ncbi:hypothetical protein K443DRAFT_133206 [Laccaria amethystina LaAM-08-1]|uniref:Uncharacterized protein n=1 Tax=Laccaria amethystina LaAM-08-1 TaxID=1095629 RepID=A0A0C9X218_9AGAR|nr:hypothetical protein K443DRAFT_133206 [Laccaria amethystina LaAM-08-1]
MSIYSDGFSYCYPSSALDIKDTIQRLGVATSNNVYDKISVFSTYWGSDDTGADKDSLLFIETIQKLHNVKAHQHILLEEHTGMKLAREVFNALPSGTPSRRLFIFHYAGHSISSTFLTPKGDQKWGTGPQIDPSRLIKDLKAEASTQLGLDVLFILDSCCQHCNVEGPKSKGRVEWVAATGYTNLANARTASDGRNFTQYWCAAFNRLLDTGKPFVFEDIMTTINPDAYVRPFPGMFVTSPPVVTVFHLKGNPDSPSVKQLIEYLNNAPVPIKILGIVPVESGTLLLLNMTLFLQELLEGSRVAIMLDDYDLE